METRPGGAKPNAVTGLSLLSIPPRIKVEPARLGGAGFKQEPARLKGTPIHCRNGKV